MHTRSSIRGERRSLPSWTCRGLELPVQILARCANPSLTCIHTNLAFTSILTHATPAYKAEIITFVHKIKLYVYFEKLSCLLRERERERKRENDRSQTADEHSNAQSPVYIWKTGLALF